MVGVGPELLVAQAGVRGLRVHGAAAPEGTDPPVVDTRRREPLLHGRAREVGVAAAAWVAADVDDDRDAGADGEAGEVAGGEGPVAEGANGRTLRLGGRS